MIGFIWFLVNFHWLRRGCFTRLFILWNLGCRFISKIKHLAIASNTLNIFVCIRVWLLIGYIRNLCLWSLLILLILALRQFNLFRLYMWLNISYWSHILWRWHRRLRFIKIIIVSIIIIDISKWTILRMWRLC